MPNVEISSTPENIVELLVSTKIEPSKRQAREDVSNGAISINGDRVTDLNFVINPSDEFDGKFVVIRKGKKNYFLAKVIDQNLVSFYLEKGKYYYNIPILKPILKQNAGCR